MKIIKIFGVFLTGTLGAGCASTSEVRSCRPEKFRLGTQDFQVEVSRYGGHRSSKSMIIVPPTGRTNYVDRSYAKEFCSAGYDVYLMDSWTGDIETTTELEIHERFYGNAQRAIAVVIEEIKSPFIGLIGTSVGGLHASIAASYQDRLDAVFVITAGIPVAEVIVNSKQDAMVGLRKDRQKRYGFSTGEENVEAIGKAFTFEPQQTSSQHSEKDLGMSIGLEDTVVPYENQKKLQEFWKPQKVVTFSNDHFWAIVNTWLFKTDELIDFFEQSFKKRKK